MALEGASDDSCSPGMNIFTLASKFLKLDGLSAAEYLRIIYKIA